MDISTSKGVTPKIAIVTELVYAIVYFPLMIVPYRLIVGTMDWRGLYRIITFGAAWLFCVAGFILYIGVRAIHEEEGVSLRGMLSGVVLEMTLMAAALM